VRFIGGVTEFGINAAPIENPTWATLGGTNASAFYGRKLSGHWGITVLCSVDWQLRKGRDGDGWAGLLGYGRGFVRARF